MSRIILLDGGMGRKKPAATFLNNGNKTAGAFDG